ncbi:MAG: DUF1840 domain-containing protein, partial [Candidatus Accumulibacter sp.]|jgi:Sec-independent protein translocase protein TatA|nr:DUF1840 domain-containing protein [Accumulibacter sp.]
MLAEHAREIFAWMDKERAARGVFTLEQLPEAMTRLRRGIEEDKREARRRAEEETEREKEKEEEARQDAEKDADEDEAPETPGEDEEKQSSAPVTLAQRAQPLLRLMEQTLKEGGYILWEAPERF